MIDGMDRLMKRLEKLDNISMERPVEKAIYHVQDAAKDNLRGHSNSGNLREKILVATEQQEDRTLGICYTNETYAPHVEFGTGPKGQKNHAGVSPNSVGTYVQSPWWIHESMIEGGREAAEKYHWFSIDTPEGRFYQCTGQAAHPFMYPALKDHEEEVTEIIMDDLRRQLK